MKLQKQINTGTTVDPVRPLLSDSVSPTHGSLESQSSNTATLVPWLTPLSSWFLRVTSFLYLNLVFPLQRPWCPIHVTRNFYDERS